MYYFTIHHRSINRFPFLSVLAIKIQTLSPSKKSYRDLSSPISLLLLFGSSLWWYDQLSIQFQMFSNCKREVAHEYVYNSIAFLNRKYTRARFTLLKVNTEVRIMKYSSPATLNRRNSWSSAGELKMYQAKVRNKRTAGDKRCYTQRILAWKRI